MSRIRLRNHRDHRVTCLSLRRQYYTIGFSQYPDGRLAENFISATKTSSQAADDARDAVIARSLAFQHSVDPEVIRRALPRDSSGSPVGIAGTVLDLLAGEDSP